MTEMCDDSSQIKNIKNETNKVKRCENDGKNTNLLMRMSTGWLSERYSTTTVHRYWGSQLSGNFSIIPPSLDSEMASDESVIRINWDEKQLQCWVCK